MTRTVDTPSGLCAGGARILRNMAVATGLLLPVGFGGAAESAEPMTLTVWSNTYISEAGKQIFKDYEKATGNTLDVQYIPDPFEQTTLQKWAAGERPDILYFHAIPKWLLRLNPKETLFDLSDRPFVKAAKGDYLLQSAAYDGVVYGAPLDAPSVLGAFYNKPLFKRLGLTPPTNLAELEKVLEAIKADGQVPPIFSAGGTQWPLLLLPYAAMQDLVTGSDFATNLRANKAKWTDQQVIDAIQVERDFFDKGYYNEDVLERLLRSGARCDRDRQGRHDHQPGRRRGRCNRRQVRPRPGQRERRVLRHLDQG